MKELIEKVKGLKGGFDDLIILDDFDYFINLRKDGSIKISYYGIEVDCSNLSRVSFFENLIDSGGIEIVTEKFLNESFQKVINKRKKEIYNKKLKELELWK